MLKRPRDGLLFIALIAQIYFKAPYAEGILCGRPPGGLRAATQAQKRRRSYNVWLVKSVSHKIRAFAQLIAASHTASQVG
jgi:hypothetical protein